MPSQNIHVIAEAFKNLEEASEAFATLQKQFRYFQEHIDVENIISKSLTAEVIKAGSITAGEITVNELSALSANLGTILAGFIYGTYIATRNGAYPRAEMSNTDNLFGAYASAVKYIRMTALDGSTSAPTMVMLDGAAGISSSFYLDNLLNELSINCGDNIQISAMPAGNVKINGNNVIVNGVNVNSGLASNMAFDPATRNLKLFAPNGNTIATVNIP